MREEPLPPLLRSRRQTPSAPLGPEGIERANQIADLIPNLEYHNPRPFLPDIDGTYHLHLAAREFRRQVQLRQLQRQREKLVLAALGLPLVAMLLKLLWSIFSGGRWGAPEAHTASWQGFVGGVW
ncbi:hypothetical protein KVR01_001233 [Diaporthe batatas]|uniref:uncharacterized protein n=1 Tax=Diaporthe batatas TaxID=748121 RepID=UPI001D053F17|nr:uncharacterized protein KVR01_001233 [Diaporthe batatas]KAG8168484.1 hypothetical protein KVR01_001233 [Diaporthe batatas]